MKTCRLKDYSPKEDCDQHVWVDNVDLCDRCLRKRLKEVRPEATSKSGLLAKYIDTFIVAVITAAGTYAFGDMSSTTDAAKTIVIVKDEHGRTCGQITIGGEEMELPEVPIPAPPPDVHIMRRWSTVFDGDPPLFYLMGAGDDDDTAIALSDKWAAFGRLAWSKLSGRLADTEVHSRPMHDRAQAEAAVKAFLAGTERVLLLNGTFQNEKHKLALNSVSANYPPPATLLFCSGVQHQLESSLGTKPKAGGLRLGKNVLHTQTKRSKSKVKNVDVAIVYPLDSFDIEEGTACVADLIARGVKKIMLVTWTDNRELGWVDQYSPVRVTFDAEEERADYHERMQEHVAEKRVEVPRNLPEYAKQADPEKLVNIDCRHCKKSRWAVMNVPYPGKDALQDEDAGYKATCLVCGNVDHYSSDWYGRP